MAKKIYPIGLLANGILFFLLILWIGLSLKAGISPLAYGKSLVSSNKPEPRPVPVEFYERQDWINGIDPKDTTREGLNEREGLITIRFSRKMDRTSFRELSRSITSGDTPLEPSGGEWIDEYTFIMKVPRKLLEGESLKMTLEFQDATGKTFPPVRLNYE